MDEPPLLIISGDDFGLTTGTCDAILQAHERGVLTATSALTVAPAFARNAKHLASSGIDVGLHVALVGEDPPILGRAEITSLVDERGRVPLSWRTFIGLASTGRIDPADVHREASAQLELLVATGCRPSHIDAHQHLQLWPAVAATLVPLAVRHQVPAIRVPTESGRSPKTFGVNRLAKLLRRRIDRNGLAAPEAFHGLSEAGNWSTSRLLAALTSLADDPPQSIEIGTHPGQMHDHERSRYRWGYSWSDELDMLQSRDVRLAIERFGFQLAGFGDLTAKNYG